MKQKQFLSILLMTFILFSCSSDDDTSVDEENTLIGRWKLVSIFDDGELIQADECENKSIVEFKDDNTFKEILVTNEEESNNCEYNGFGTTGTFTLDNEKLIRTSLEVIAIPEELNVPGFIEGAKGVGDLETISFDNNELSITMTYEEQGVVFSTTYTFEASTDDFFTE